MNKYIKLFISALILAFGLFLAFNRNVGWGIVCIVFSAIPILLFFKNEYILAAFWHMRKQNFAKASSFLSRIKRYESQLHKSQYGYFYYMQGLSISQDQPLKIEPYMKKALQYGLRMKHDRALATLNLSLSALYKGRKQEATRLLEEARRLDTAGMMDDQIRMVRDQLKMPSMKKHVHNPHMRQRGKFF